MSVDRPARSRPLTLGELVVLILIAWALWAMNAHAHLAPIKTAPVATGSPVQLSPSHARSMGDVLRAVDGTLGDPVVAPCGPLVLRKRQGGPRQVSLPTPIPERERAKDSGRADGDRRMWM